MARKVKSLDRANQWVPGAGRNGDVMVKGYGFLPAVMKIF